MTEGTQFSDFNGDFHTLADLMRDSWQENIEQPLDYTAEFLKGCFEYPVSSYKLAPCLYESESLQAFVAAFPRTLAFHGSESPFALLTFLTVAPFLKGRGIGVRIWAESLTRAKQTGFRGALWYCVDGNRSNHVTTKAARLLGYRVQHIFTVQYLMRFVRPGSVSHSNDNPYEAAELLPQLSRSLVQKTSLTRIWSKEEAVWQCVERPGSFSIVGKYGGRHGLLAGYVMQVCDKSRTRSLLIEEIHWAELETEEREDLLRQCLDKAAGQADIVVVPLLGYFDPAPFRVCGFRQSTRVLNAYVTPFDDTSSVQADSLYVDVL